ncbi:T9SS type A sorting domain-containing protein [Salinivirga cyanobacteriivorans]
MQKTVLLHLLLLVCLAPAAYAHTVTFEVNSYGSPVVGAQITVDSTELTTTSDGIASIELPDGAYNYVVQIEGFAALEGTFILAGEDITIYISAPSFNVTFQVTHDGQPVDSATIYFDEIYLALTTDSTGMALSGGFYPGEYHYHVVKDPYQTYDGSFTLDSITMVHHDTTFYINMVGIADQEKAPIQIYPNPANRQVTVTSEGYFNLTLFNSIGQKLLNLRAYSRINMPLEGFEKGVYFLQIKRQKKIHTRKLVIE